MRIKIVKIAVPIIIVLAGVMSMKFILSKRNPPSRQVSENRGMLVRIIKAEKTDTAVHVKGSGIAEVSKEVPVIPQVSGSVVYKSPDLVTGGFFNKGELLFEIEDTDYRLVLEQAVADRTKAEFELETMESRARIARLEWERMNKDSNESPNPLVIYEPQLRNARAALEAASARVKQAELNLERTRVSAPFNARVRSESIEKGQYVRAGSSVAVLTGTDTVEISVPLTLDDLRWLDIPVRGERTNGTSAVARLIAGNESYAWEGRVVRSTGEIDTKTRMMRIVIEIKDPYGLEGNHPGSGPGLAPGAFVNVLIRGRELENVVVIPRKALREDSTVWIADDGRLRIQKVKAIRKEKEHVIVSEGIEAGERIVLSNISGTADGMKVKTKPLNDK